jgi:hypothetical protein
VDQYLLRASAARGTGGRQRPPQAAPGTRDRRGGTGTGAAEVPLPRPDGQRCAGERGLPGLRGLLRCDAGPRPGRGGGDQVGGLGSVLRCGPHRAATDLSMVRDAVARTHGARPRAARLGLGRRGRPAPGRRPISVIHRLIRSVPCGHASSSPPSPQLYSHPWGIGSSGLLGLPQKSAGGASPVRGSAGASPRPSSSSTSSSTSSGTWPPAVHSAQRMPMKLPMPV